MQSFIRWINVLQTARGPRFPGLDRRLMRRVHRSRVQAGNDDMPGAAMPRQAALVKPSPPDASGADNPIRSPELKTFPRTAIKRRRSSPQKRWIAGSHSPDKTRQRGAPSISRSFLMSRCGSAGLPAARDQTANSSAAPASHALKELKCPGPIFRAQSRSQSSARRRRGNLQVSSEFLHQRFPIRFSPPIAQYWPICPQKDRHQAQN